MRWLCFDWFPVNNLFDSANLGSCPVFFLAIRSGLSAACYLSSCTTQVSTNSVPLSLEKCMATYCLRNMEAGPLWGCRCLDIIHVSFAFSATLIVYQEAVNTKHSGRQRTRSKDGRGSRYQLCGECHYLRSAYWEAPRASTRACCMFCHALGLPFNTFPRAALKMHHRSPEIGKQYSQ